MLIKLTYDYVIQITICICICSQYSYIYIILDARLTAMECLDHPWLHTFNVNVRKDTHVETAHLRRYMARRRWKRCFNAVLAMNRMTSNGIFDKRKSAELVIKEGMLGDYGELGFFV